MGEFSVSGNSLCSSSRTMSRNHTGGIKSGAKYLRPQYTRYVKKMTELASFRPAVLNKVSFSFEKSFEGSVLTLFRALKTYLLKDSTNLSDAIDRGAFS
jgi:hypothetical protein